jgi:hypothetical protein
VAEGPYPDRRHAAENHVAGQAHIRAKAADIGRRLHPDTLDVRASLAHWTGEAGDAAGARDQYAALLPLYESVLGPQHPETLAARASLAHWTEEAERGTN